MSAPWSSQWPNSRGNGADADTDAQAHRAQQHAGVHGVGPQTSGDAWAWPRGSAPGTTHARAAQGGTGDGSTSASAPAASPRTTPAEDACAEVERQLREKMDEPLAARKKILKDLMLEYHPDKNNCIYAKDVFQFINN